MQCGQKKEKDITLKLCFVFLKLIYRVNAISTKIITAFLSFFFFFFPEVDKLILKSIRNFKELRTDKRTLEKKNKVGGFTLPNLKTYCKTIVAKTVWYWHKGRHREQENKNEIPEINISITGRLKFDKNAKTIQGKKQ